MQNILSLLCNFKIFKTNYSKYAKCILYKTLSLRSRKIRNYLNYRDSKNNNKRSHKNLEILLPCNIYTFF